MIHLIDFQDNILRIHFNIEYPSITKGMLDIYAALDEKSQKDETLSEKETADLEICKKLVHMPIVKFNKAEIISINGADNNIFDLRMYNELKNFMNEFTNNPANFESIENIYYQQF